MASRPLSQKFLISTLVVAGLYLIILGAQRFYEHYQVKQIALEFVSALETGNQAQIRALLTPEKADLAEKLKQDSQNSAAPLDCRILDVKLDGDAAQVRIQIQKEGYAIKPDIHLLKSQTGVWKVSSISQAKVDPLWYDQEDRKYREQLIKEGVPPEEVQGRVLAKELARSLHTTVEDSSAAPVNP
ncbi:hypothetical protein Enr10x_10560 [Gimesia panareensis]|uniref:DUF4878 domain-containing protein n=1 Tax=Gimesia panareensis TaxID=2527978 RepID=A0A517Q292_9PLAN|nr:DUF4878 domain-containing protein [Gimesia panareensis]QDT25759.1 hypothetical protein Enr10x_10560 [Gimesia panareensis]